MNPTPSASRELIRPRTSIRPRVGGSTPAIERIRVDLPAPLAPMIPSDVPRGTSKETWLTASTSRTARSPRPRRTIALLNVGIFSKVVR